MTVMDNEDTADPSLHEPRVTGSPDAIWLVYGDLERDDTHANCADSGEVTWCEDAQFPADVRYTRTDLVAERVRAAVAEERERWERAATMAAQELAHCVPYSTAGIACAELRALLGPNAKLTGDQRP
jgi:hypothetical protein